MNGCYSRLLQESNLAARQPQGATSVIQAITVEGLAQGPYVAARGGVEPTTFRTEGTDNLHLTKQRPGWDSLDTLLYFQLPLFWLYLYRLLRLIFYLIRQSLLYLL